MNIFDWERGNEKIDMIGNPFNESDKLNITVKNIGEVNVVLNCISVKNSSNLEPIINDCLTQYYLRPGETEIEIGTNINQTFTGGFNGTFSYIVQLWTSRGTVKSIRHPPLEKEYTPVINKIYSGPFEFDQESPSFNYTSKDIDGGINNTFWFRSDGYYLYYPAFMCKDSCNESCNANDDWCMECKEYIVGIHESYKESENPEISRSAYEMFDYYDHIVFEVSLKNVVDQSIQIHQSSFLLVIVPAYQSTGETEL
jgi:hypothetical protein